MRYWLSAAAHTPKHASHLPDFPSLRLNDRIKDWDQLRTDAVAQGILGHGDGSAVVGNHFTNKIFIDTVGRAGVFHLTEHGLHDFFCTGLVAAQIVLAVVYRFALAEDRLHIGDAFGLPGDDLEGEILQGDVGGVA